MAKKTKKTITVSVDSLNTNLNLAMVALQDATKVAEELKLPHLAKIIGTESRRVVSLFPTDRIETAIVRRDKRIANEKSRKANAKKAEARKEARKAKLVERMAKLQAEAVKLGIVID